MVANRGQRGWKIPLYGWEVVRKGLVEMGLSPGAERHSCLFQEKLAQGIRMSESAEVGN